MTRRISTTANIVDSASALFFEHGFSSVSVDSIAAAASTTKVTVYHHFRSKETIFLACLDQHLKTRDQALAATFDDQPHQATTLLDFFDWMQASVIRNKFKGCAYLKAVHELSQTIPEVCTIARQAKRSLRQRIVRVASASGLNHPKELGRQLAVLLEGAQSLSLIERSTAPFLSARAAAITLLLAHGWKPANKCLQLHLEKCR